MMRFLNGKEKKRFYKQLGEQYGFEGDLGCEIVLSTSGKYYLLTRDAAEFPYEALRVESSGLYIAKQEKDGLRVSVEGSQLIGPSCTKNLIELNDEEHHEWIRGREVDLSTDVTGWVILTHTNSITLKKDFLGGGKMVHKNDRIVIHNYVPKTRYVRSED